MKIKNYTIVLMVLAFAGFLESSYLTFKDLTHSQVACSIVTGCETVLTSKYSHIGPIPVSLLGVGYYLCVFLASSAYLMHRRRIFARAIKLLVPIGLGASAVFVSLQLFVIHSICVYCFGSAIDSTLIFLVGWYAINHPPSEEIIIEIGD